MKRLYALLLLAGGLAQAAPAPLPRKETPHNSHPAWALGDHTLHWFSTPYRVEFRCDGTFVIPYEADPSEAQYKGTWELDRNGDLIYMEWPASRYGSGDPCSFKYTFAWTASGWKCIGSVHRICRPGAPRPTD